VTVTNSGFILLFGVLAAIMGTSGCASAPGVSEGQKASPKWTVPSEEEVAAALDNDREMQEAARDLVKLKKDNELMFCKRYREVGSNIPTIKCITEAELRERVMNMTRYRDDMRNKGGKCTRSVGCSGGG